MAVVPGSWANGGEARSYREGSPLQEMPVGEPGVRPRKLAQRASPGDPSCGGCRAAGGTCEDHADYHAACDLLRSVGGHRGAVSREDAMRWEAVL